MGEKVDCRDSVNKWLEATIVDKREGSDGTEVKVSFTNYSSKYDEWIGTRSGRILKRFKPGQSWNEL